MTNKLNQIIADKAWTDFDARALFDGGKSKCKKAQNKNANNAQSNQAKPADGQGQKRQASAQPGRSAKQIANMMRDGMKQMLGTAMGSKKSQAKTNAVPNNQAAHELEVAFKKGRELIAKLAAEPDFTTRVSGRQRWDGKQLTKTLTTYRYDSVTNAKYKHPCKSDVVLLLDISPSCEAQARMFMAIAAGAASKNVRIFVGFNGTASRVPLAPPAKPFKSYAQAQDWVERELSRERNLNDFMFSEFVRGAAPKTCVIFGDYDGEEQYADVVQNPQLRSAKFFWFANVPVNDDTHIPYGFNSKNFQPGINTPAELVIALRKLK
jgi:hypothetical protein